MQNIIDYDFVLARPPESSSYCSIIIDFPPFSRMFSYNDNAREIAILQ